MTVLAPSDFEIGSARTPAATAVDARPALIEVQDVSKVFGGDEMVDNVARKSLAKTAAEWVGQHSDVAKSWMARLPGPARPGKRRVAPRQAPRRRPSEDDA